ncbi:MAG: hypothetical protein ACRD1U_15665 [Vicinamibacterales bacterium]
MRTGRTVRDWLVLMERRALQGVMTLLGLGLIATGLGVGVSLSMLPPGLLLGMTGAGVVLWAVLGDLPDDR